MKELERRVLIVDDCPEDRETYRRYLLQDPDYTYVILEEESGERGLELCRLVKPDSVLLDYLLPDIDGLEFLDELRSHSGKVDIPVVMVSGYGNEAVAVQAMKNGASDYLVKGKTTSDSLRLTLRHAMEKAELIKQLETSEERFRTTVENLQQIESELAQLLVREQAARAEAEAANRKKDEFLAIVSHELRSPLNSILAWTQLLQTRKFDQLTTDRALETIKRSVKLQNHLIEDLLDISRIIQGQLRLDICPIELVPTIEATISMVLPSCDAKRIKIECLLDSSAGQVLGDSSRLQQVVWNLLSNAIKFTPEGGCITIRLERFGSEPAGCPYAQLQVSDTGEGICPEFLPYVFEQFRQADTPSMRVHNGLGLGLAIVRSLVELHNGTVEAGSEGEGQGATFTVKLPLK